MDSTSCEETPTVLLPLLGEGSVCWECGPWLTCWTVPELKALAQTFKVSVSTTGKKQAEIVSNLLELGKSGKLAHIMSETGRDVSTFT